MSASQRRKGHEWEREVARMFRSVLGVESMRGAQYSAGNAMPDVILPGFWVECKAGKTVNEYNALAQAEAASETSTGPHRLGIPVAICKQDRKIATVTMSLIDFMFIAQQLKVVQDSMLRPPCVTEGEDHGT